MTAEEAKQLGAIKTTNFKTGKREAVFNSVNACARFRSELIKRGIQFTDHFAMGGKAIKFTWHVENESLARLFDAMDAFSGNKAI